jgi:superfamily II RNA helicase
MLYRCLSDVLLDLASSGIGVHHAGLSIADRRRTEALYIQGLLRVIVSTSVRAILAPSAMDQKQLTCSLCTDTSSRRESP